MLKLPDHYEAALTQTYMRSLSGVEIGSALYCSPMKLVDLFLRMFDWATEGSWRDRGVQLIPVGFYFGQDKDSRDRDIVFRVFRLEEIDTGNRGSFLVRRDPYEWGPMEVRVKLHRDFANWSAVLIGLDGDLRDALNVPDVH